MLYADNPGCSEDVGTHLNRNQASPSNFRVTAFVTHKSGVLRSQVIYSKQPNLGLTQESLRMVTVRVLGVLSGSFTSQIETGPILT